MEKPGGTGRPRLAISASPAPLPPSRLRMLGLPSALPPPKAKTHLPLAGGFTARAEAFGFVAALALAAFRTGFLDFAPTRDFLRLAMTQNLLDGSVAFKKHRRPW